MGGSGPAACFSLTHPLGELVGNGISRRIGVVPTKTESDQELHCCGYVNTLN
jgi:hypothetical protein